MSRVTDGRGSLAIRVPLSLLLAFGPPLPAAVIVADGGACDLASAILAANSDSAQGGCPAGSGADVILLTTDVTLTAVDNQTDGDNGLPSITGELIIRGDGVAHRGIVRDPGAPAFRILHVADGAVVEVENLSLRNGNASGNRGGAIRNGGDLTVRQSVLAGNVALLGGAISSSSTGVATKVTISGSTLENNSAGIVGGALFVDASYDAATELVVRDSTMSGNSATAGGAISTSSYGTASVSLTNSTLSGNSASGRGGAIDSLSYGILDLTLVHSTLSGNQAAGGGAAIYNRYANVVADSTLIGHSLLGANCAGSPPISTQSNSLADDASCGPVPAGLDGLDPVLAPNGGPTDTHALLEGSAAVDLAGACALPVDQRGFERDPLCDAGAYELGASPPPMPVGGTLTGTAGRRVRCVNLTTGQSVEIALGGGLSWNCEAAGLVVSPGDRVREIVSGEVD